MKQIWKLLAGQECDFQYKCKTRLTVAAVLFLLGLTAVLKGGGFFTGSGDGTGLNISFYASTGIGLMAASTLLAMRNIRYLKNKELAHKRAVYENDERNRLLGLRCWSYTGYLMFLGLYAAILAVGDKNAYVMATLLTVMGIYAVLLLVVRYILSRVM